MKRPGAALIAGICIVGSAAFSITAEAKCAVRPPLAGKMQAKGGIKALFQYTCEACESCQVSGRTGCRDMKSGRCASATKGQPQPVVGRVKYNCRPIEAYLLNSLNEKGGWGEGYVAFPPEIVADGDVFLKTGICGGSPYQLWLSNKTNDAKYVRIIHNLEEKAGEARDINGIMIAVAQKDKLGCRDQFCEYSIAFTINGEDKVLAPGQTYQGKGFTLKSITSRVAAEGAPITEDAYNTLVYEIFFRGASPSGGF